MSRSRTVERRKEREREKRRQRQIALVVIVVAVVAIAALALILASQPAEAPIPETAAARYADIPQSKTEDGFPRLGSPDAPVNLIEYSSFDCPACRLFHENATTTILERVRADEVVFTFVPMYGTGGIINGRGAALAAVCAGEQGKYWEFMDALFSWQGLYANQAFSNNRIESGINNLGIDRGAWGQCMSSELPERVVTAANNAARNLPGFEGTPTITINGILVAPDVASVTRAIDQELERLGPVLPAETPVVEPTPEETPEMVEEAAESTPEAEAESEAEAEPEATETP